MQVSRVQIFGGLISAMVIGCSDATMAPIDHDALSTDADALSEIGAEFAVPTTATTGAQNEIIATVVDLNQDGTADGLDLNGDGFPELLFTYIPQTNLVGIDIDGQSGVDYYIAVDGADLVILAPDGAPNGQGTAVTVVLDKDGQIIGFDINGDGSVDDPRLGALFSDTQGPFVIASRQSGTYGPPLGIHFFCSDNYGCQHLTWSVNGPTGQTAGTIFDFTEGISLSTQGGHSLTYRAFDFAGNPSEPQSLTVSITNQPGLVVLGTAGLTTSESGRIASFELRLQTRPTQGPVTVAAMSSQTSEGTIIGDSSFVFTQDNWADVRRIYIQGADDSAPERDGHQTYQVEFTLSGSSEYASLSPTTVDIVNLDNERYIYQIGSSVSGDMGGISGADNLCNTDPARPDDSVTYKALMTDGTTRIATVTGNAGDGQVDWVLEAHTDYMRPPPEQEVRIFRTNAVGLFDFSADADNSPVDGFSGGSTWTGFLADWRDDGNNCNAWTNGDIGTFGHFGRNWQSGAGIINFDTDDCDRTALLYCIEQP